MIKYITIECWYVTKSIQANKPTKMQKLLAWLKLRPLPKPLYWFEVDIAVRRPHPLRIGDRILCNSLIQYHVMARNKGAFMPLLESREEFVISSIEPAESCVEELGRCVILGSCYSEMDPNTQPYGGQMI